MRQRRCQDSIREYEPMEDEIVLPGDNDAYDSASVDSSIKYESSYAYDHYDGYEEGMHGAYGLSSGLRKIKNKSEKSEPQSTGRQNRSF